MTQAEREAFIQEHVEGKTKEELVAELEAAGFEIRWDLEGHGILNPDGTKFEYEKPYTPVSDGEDE